MWMERGTILLMLDDGRKSSAPPEDVRTRTLPERSESVDGVPGAF